MYKVSLNEGIQPLTETEMFYSPLMRYSLLVYYPHDFSHVCPVEMLELDPLVPKFEELGCTVWAISSDSPFCHKAWLSAPTEFRGLGGLCTNLTLVSQPDPVEEREVLIWDGSRDEFVYSQKTPDNIARNFDEALRVMTQIQELELKPNHYCTKSLDVPAFESLG
jgi:alkyl hydroperoxide reductase subunit AhpC